MRPSPLAIAAVAATLAQLGTSSAHAGARQFHMGPTLGGFWTSGIEGGAGGSVGVSAGYGLNDTFRLYGDLDYRLGASVTGGSSPHQAASFAAGIAYTLDVVSVVPWLGIGAEAAGVFTPTFVGFAPAVEARGGFDWLIERYFGLTFQVAYGFVLANRQAVGDNVMGSVGLRWAVDL